MLMVNRWSLLVCYFSRISDVLMMFCLINTLNMSSCLFLIFNWFFSIYCRTFMCIFIRFSSGFLNILCFFRSVSIWLTFFMFFFLTQIFMVHWSFFLFLFIFMILFLFCMNFLFNNLIFGFILFDVSTLILIRSAKEVRKSLIVWCYPKKENIKIQQTFSINLTCCMILIQPINSANVQ